MSKRIEWIDRAKGIGIILVILGHSIFLEIFKILIYSFHMPLFFSYQGISARRAWRGYFYSCISVCQLYNLAFLV